MVVTLWQAEAWCPRGHWGTRAGRGPRLPGAEDTVAGWWVVGGSHQLQEPPPGTCPGQSRLSPQVREGAVGLIREEGRDQGLQGRVRSTQLVLQPHSWTEEADGCSALCGVPSAGCSSQLRQAERPPSPFQGADVKWLPHDTGAGPVLDPGPRPSGSQPPRAAVCPGHTVADLVL